jgi:hypothetical protein
VRLVQRWWEDSAFEMPPRRGESIERTDDHEEFVKKVAEYHEKRGYVFCQLAESLPISVRMQADVASQPIGLISILNPKLGLDTSTCCTYTTASWAKVDMTWFQILKRSL